MDSSYVKLVLILKKNDALSYEEFRDHYENEHARFISVIPSVRKYVRRYLENADGSGSLASPEISMITELWFDSRGDLDIALQQMRDGTHPEISADEEYLFDRARMTMGVVDKQWTPLVAK